MVIAVSYATFWVRLSHSTNKRMLADHYTLDQLIIIHSNFVANCTILWKSWIFAIIFTTKLFKIIAIFDFFFIKSFLIYNEIFFILILMLDVNFPSVKLIFSEFLLSFSKLGVPWMKKLIFFECSRALHQSHLD